MKEQQPEQRPRPEDDPLFDRLCQSITARMHEARQQRVTCSLKGLIAEYRGEWTPAEVRAAIGHLEAQGRVETFIWEMAGGGIYVRFGYGRRSSRGRKRT